MQTKKTDMKTPALIKQETQAITGKLFAFVVMFGLMLLLSCNTDEEAALEAEAQDSETAQLDAMEDLYNDDADDLATDVMMSEDFGGGKIASNDSRLACATVTRTG